MSAALDMQRIVADDGEFIESDQQVDLAEYTHFVDNFRPHPQVQWAEWDFDRVISLVLMVGMVVGSLLGLVALFVFGSAKLGFDPFRILNYPFFCTLGVGWGDS